MTLTQDPVIIEDIFRDFFENIFANENLRKGFENLNRVIEIVYHQPDLSFIIECRKDNIKFISGADGTYKPDISILMKWETAHDFWMGDLDPISALFSQKIIVKGDAGALLDLKPLFKETSNIYRQVVTNCNSKINEKT